MSIGGHARSRTSTNARGLSAARDTSQVSALPRRIEKVAFTTMRAWTSLTIVAASLAVACGSSSHTSSGPGSDGGLDATPEGDDTSGSDSATELDGGASDAGHADGATDAGSASSSDASGFACGNIVCNRDEVCVHQSNGCMIQMLRDSTCPNGSETSDGSPCGSSGPPPY